MKWGRRGVNERDEFVGIGSLGRAKWRHSEKQGNPEYAVDDDLIVEVPNSRQARTSRCSIEDSIKPNEEFCGYSGLTLDSWYAKVTR
jgi:hypothetical protein